jgi:two-component system nitrogen regulation response regulator GlnG
MVATPMAPVEVVLVEDDAVIRRSLRRALVGAGASVRDFATAEDALEHLKPDALDLLITDLRLPGLDGLSLAAATRARGCRCRVILITGSYDLDDEARRSAVGPEDVEVLRKPFSLSAVTALVTACRGG